jgi:pimeloyl-ACP methyl ester carboxylesterase
LIHGAWHGAWCWERVAPVLRAAGHRVVAPDLPGHGEDRTPWWRVSLGAYARRAREAARAAGPVVAVGHSMGGLVATQAAADEPGLFRGVVYLCAFAPAAGESLRSLGAADPGTLVPAATRLRFGALAIDPRRAPGVFYNTCAPADAHAAAARLRPTPALPLLQGVRRPDELETPLAYIECAEDHAISLALQRRMHGRFPMARVTTLATDHSPFLCAPDALARELEAAAIALEGVPRRPRGSASPAGP